MRVSWFLIGSVMAAGVILEPVPSTNAPGEDPQSNVGSVVTNPSMTPDTNASRIPARMPRDREAQKERRKREELNPIFPYGTLKTEIKNKQPSENSGRKEEKNAPPGGLD